MMRDFCVAAMLLLLTTFAFAGESAAPKGLQGESSLSDRYPCVARDMLKYCRPHKGFWVDLGAGRGQVTIPLIRETGNPVVMLDPDSEAMSKGLESARQKGLADRLLAVVGVAEAMPFPDNSVDFVASRGSIFFWDDPVKGLREVYRVLRPGGKAYIGGGAGSSYPKEATEKLIERRKSLMEGEDAEKWKRFHDLRRPEQMRSWATEAGLPEFEVMGKGAISAEDSRVGQGVWVMFEKKPEVVTKNETDRITVEAKGETVLYSIASPSGIGRAEVSRWKGWPKRVVVRLHLRGLESFTVSDGKVKLSVSVQSHGEHAKLRHVWEDGREKALTRDSPYWTKVEVLDAKGNAVGELPPQGGCFRITLPEELLKEKPKSLTFGWIDFYRS